MMPPLRCRLGLHQRGQIISVRHMVRSAAGRTGSVVTYRCARCGRRSRHWTDRYLWRLDTVQRRD